MFWIVFALAVLGILGIIMAPRDAAGDISPTVAWTCIAMLLVFGAASACMALFGKMDRKK